MARFDDRRLAGRAAGILVLIGVGICRLFITPWSGGTPCIRDQADAAKYRSSDAFAAALVDFCFLLLSATLTLMRMRNLILLRKNAVRG